MTTIELINRIKTALGDRSYIVTPNGHGLGRDKFAGHGQYFEDISSDVMIPTTTHDHENIENTVELDAECQEFMKEFRRRQTAEFRTQDAKLAAESEVEG